MKNNGKITNKLIIILIVVASVFAIYIKANAASTVGSASIGYTVNNNANIGDEITAKVNVNNVNVDSSNIGICGVGGNISFDSDYLEFISATGMSSPYAVSVNKNNNYKFAGIDFTLSNGFSSATDIITLKFKTLKTGSTTLSLANVLLNDCNNNKLSVTPVSKTITIGTPVIKDSNNYLSALSITGYTISPAFNKNTTSYSLTVPNNVSSVTLNATKESAKATLTGTGNKSLSVGANNISVVVTAENGNKRTYTITVTRQSAIQKSSDNSLKDLSVPGYTLSPVFNKDNLDYTLKVPNDATKIDVKAITNNEKSSVKIVGNTDLKVGNNVVTVEVPHIAPTVVPTASERRAPLIFGSLPSLSSMSALEATPIRVPRVSNISTNKNANMITIKSSEKTPAKSIFIKVGAILGTEIPLEKSGRRL